MTLRNSLRFVVSLRICRNPRSGILFCCVFCCCVFAIVFVVLFCIYSLSVCCCFVVVVFFVVFVWVFFGGGLFFFVCLRACLFGFLWFFCAF